ncbi:MAG: AMP-binding protein [Rhizobiales bacterium]|nr:AMP-binding protein [Hyphomicrobiales bacterium]
MTILNESMRETLSQSLFDNAAEDNFKSTSIHKDIGNISYLKGSQKEPLIYTTIGKIFSKTVEKFGPREAAIFVDQNMRLTYYDLDREVDRLAGGLLSLGLKTGDRVGIWSPNRYEWLVTQFATAKIGLILVNINPAYRLTELEYALNKVECKALILAPQFKSSNYIEMIQTLIPELEQSESTKFTSAKIPSLNYIISMGDSVNKGILGFDQVCKMAAPAHKIMINKIANRLDPDDAINIQFTSGTTGTPKGATLSHYNILNNANFVTQTMQFSENDILCIPVPLYHCFGMVMGTLGCVVRGSKMVFPSEAFDATSCLNAIEQEKCTALYGVPTMFVSLFSDASFKTRDYSSLRTGIMAGALCPIEVMNRAVNEMNLAQITICYGMTETSPVSFQTHVNTPLDKRVSTVGLVHPQLEVKVIDEAGKTVAIGEKGELCTRGYSVMLGYWGDTETTNSAIDASRWMHTGDLAVFDKQNYCTIVGRIKDMIIRGGENIYPKEIEDFLFKHDAIINVQIFGVHSDQYGEEVCAFITSKDGSVLKQEDVKAFCKGQIAHYKIPKYIKFVNEMPMTVTGKPQKFVMKDMMEKELNITY